LLVEVQALVAPTYATHPRRITVGWDGDRLDMILAVLHSRYKLNVLDKEVYLNIVGGVRIQEPGADLAVALAIISSANDVPPHKHYVAFGEIGLGGEIRSVPGSAARIREAVKLGFRDIVLSANGEAAEEGANLVRVKHVNDLRRLIKE
jgi:DNA repair protein RadA/Sms